MLTEKELRRYEILLESKIDVNWTRDDIQALFDEIKRRPAPVEAPPEQPSHWALRTRFVGGH